MESYCQIWYMWMRLGGFPAKLTFVYSVDELDAVEGVGELMHQHKAAVGTHAVACGRGSQADRGKDGLDRVPGPLVLSVRSREIVEGQ